MVKPLARAALAPAAAFAVALALLTAPAMEGAAQSVSGELPPIGREPALNDDERAYLSALGPIRIAVDPDWKPYEWIDQSGAFKGIAADLIELMAERLGLDVEVVKTPDWPTSLELAKSGGAHALAFLNRSPAREEWLLFTEPYFVDPNVYVTRQDQDFIADPARLGAKTVVFPEGTSLEEHIRRRYPNLRVITAPSEEEAFRMVQDGRADMTLRSLTMAAYVLRRDGLFDLKIAGQYTDFTNQFRLGVVKSKPELLGILDKAVATVTPDDVQAAINRYISIEARAWVDYRPTVLALVAFVAVGSVGSLAYAKLVSLNRRLRAREAELSALSAKLESYADHLRLVIDTIPAYIYAKDGKGRFILANKAFAGIFGCSPEEVVGKTNLDYGATEEETRRYIDEDREVLANGRPLFVPEERGPRPDRTPGWFQTTKIPYKHPDWDEPAILGVSIDITERREQAEIIKHLAQHDGLTDLPNRALFASLFGQALDLAARERSGLAVLFIDLDGFKPVNDLHGHAAGDELLKALAARIRATLRGSDRAGRIGGDEFVAFLQNVPGPEAAAVVASKLLSAIEEPVAYEGAELRVGASIGVALYPDHARDQDALFRLADEAMYRAKRAGGRRIELA